MATKPGFSFDSVKKTVLREVHEIKTKIGQAEETVDIQMNQELEKFKGQYKHMKEIKEDSKNVMKLLKELTIAQSKLTEHLNAVFESGDPMYQGMVQMQYATQDLDAARLAMEEQWRDDFESPFSSYLGLFAEIDKRKEERERRRLDMDRYRDEVKRRTEKASENTVKLTAAKEKLQVTTDAYKELNSELLHDIPALYADRPRFFTPIVATIMDAYSRYYGNCGKAISSLAPFYAQVDRSAAHRHPSPITETELSCAYRIIGGAGEAASSTTPSATSIAPPPAVVASPPPTGYHQPPLARAYPATTTAPPGTYPPTAGNSHAAYPSPAGAHAHPTSAVTPSASPAGRSAGPPPIAPPRSTSPLASATPAEARQPAAAHSHSPNVAAAAAAKGAVRAQPVPPPRSAPSIPKRETQTLPRAKALYAFTAEGPTELSLDAGDVVSVVKESGEWWEAEKNGKRGLVPANYVQKITY